VPEAVRNDTARIIEPELQARIDKLKTLIDDGVIDIESSGNGDSSYLLHPALTNYQTDVAPKTTCSFTFYAQLHPVQVPEHLMQELEEELQNPTGIRTVPTPKLTISALLVSKECGIVYEVTKTEGLRFVHPSLSPFGESQVFKTSSDLAPSSERLPPVSCLPYHNFLLVSDF